MKERFIPWTPGSLYKIPHEEITRTSHWHWSGLVASTKGVQSSSGHGQCRDGMLETDQLNDKSGIVTWGILGVEWLLVRCWVQAYTGVWHNRLKLGFSESPKGANLRNMWKVSSWPLPRPTEKWKLEKSTGAVLLTHVNIPCQELCASF